MAKESVVSTLSVLFAPAALTALLTPLSAMSLLVFCLLYAVRRRRGRQAELGGGWALGVALGQCAVAWLAAGAVQLFGVLLGGGVMTPGTAVVLALVLIAAALALRAVAGGRTGGAAAAPATDALRKGQAVKAPHGPAGISGSCRPAAKNPRKQKSWLCFGGAGFFYIGTAPVFAGAAVLQERTIALCAGRGVSAARMRLIADLQGRHGKRFLNRRKSWRSVRYPPVRRSPSRSGRPGKAGGRGFP